MRISAAVALDHMAQRAKFYTDPWPEEMVSGLIDGLKDPEAKVRWEAASALGKIGRPARAALTALREAEKDKHPKVREKAEQALKKIGPDR